MALYSYTAKDASGKKYSGEVEVLDEKALVSTLQKQGLVPISITPKGSGKLFSVKIPKFTGSVSSSEVVGFTRQLSTMISAGLPLTDSLVIMEKQTKSAAFERIISQIVADVEGGMALSVALSKHKEVFDTIYVKLVEAGETGGVLDKVLAKLADTLEKDREFKSKTKGAFVYPVIVIIVMVIVVVIMMIFVIPKLTSLYSEVGASLPLPTRILIGTSSFLRGFWWLLIILGVGGYFAFKAFAKTPAGASLISKFFLNLPIWGKIRKTLILAQFTRTLGLLIGAGIPIITALKVVSQLLASPSYQEGLDEAIARVERGSPLYQPLSQNPIFPPIIGQMLRVGEETGKLDEVLLRLSVYFEGESENSIRNLTTALEPVILVILGLGVGVLVLSIILPIYNLTSQF
ncbi:MAG TPA: type II secretion system F family protein [Candidatus Saccharimonadales bacterium]|nr:type II secretion system F family protein [Candidatus Saccharimonadales bacterium]